jgi:ABC-2 type transport system ATP-binding protein
VARLSVEIAPGQGPDAQKALRTGRTERAVEGETLIVTGASRVRIPDVLAALVHAGVRVYRAEPVEPTLEDVYFALHEHRN